MQSGVAISSRDSVTDCIFKLNGFNIPVSWEYSGYLEEWETYTIYKDLPDSLEFMTGKSYDVYLKLNGKEYVCTIKLSDKPKVTWPKFDINSDYTFTWNLIDIPAEQTIYMYVEDNNKYTERYWHLDGEVRSHTIDKNYFSGLDETTIDLDIDIYCFNYYRDGDFVVLSESWTNINDKKNTLHRRMNIRRFINVFIPKAF